MFKNFAILAALLLALITSVLSAAVSQNGLLGRTIFGKPIVVPSFVHGPFCVRRWEGRGPYCDGECQPGWNLVNNYRYGVVPDKYCGPPSIPFTCENEYGATCLTGYKALCERCTPGDPRPRKVFKECVRSWIGLGPFCNGKCEGGQRKVLRSDDEFSEGLCGPVSPGYTAVCINRFGGPCAIGRKALCEDSCDEPYTQIRRYG